MCDTCKEIAAAVTLGHVVQFPLVPGGSPNVTVHPLDAEEGSTDD